MLYDPSWKPIAPAEVPPIEPWRELLKECIVVIKKRGWTKFNFESYDDHSVCAIGAFRVVQYGDPNRMRGKNNKYTTANVQLAKRQLLRALPFQDKQRLMKIMGDFKFSKIMEDNIKIMEWNDTLCRSKRQILATFRKAASGE